MNRNRKSVEATELPPNIKAADLKYPEREHSIPWDKIKELGLEHDYMQLTFYRTTGFGWVLCTLNIGGKGRGSTARTYGVKMDGAVVRVGRGPHVTKEITVYLSKDNLERITPYVELLKQGLGDAGTIRDRISSRRAQGQMHRANGDSSWRWNA